MVDPRGCATRRGAPLSSRMALDSSLIFAAYWETEEKSLHLSEPPHLIWKRGLCLLPCLIPGGVRGHGHVLVTGMQ